LECTVELFFDNILALTNSSILQLIRVPETRSSKSERDFRLKLVAGWHTPVDVSNEIFSTKQLEYIERSNVVYLLSLVKHDLSFNQNGSITLTIHYQGALEKYLASSSEMDIFSVSSEAQMYKFLLDISKADTANIKYLQDYITQTHNKILYEAQLETISKQRLTATEKARIDLGENLSGDRNQTSEAFKLNAEAEKEIEAKLSETLKRISEYELYIIKTKYSRFLTALENSQRLFFLPILSDTYSGLHKDLLTNNAKFWEPVLDITPINPENFAKTENRDALYTLQRKKNIAYQTIIEQIYAANGDESKLSEITANAFTFGLDQLAPSFRQTPGPSNKYIVYTTLGDIVNIARGFVEIPEADHTEILLGPCLVGKISINIASFPIALSTFMTWFVNSVIRKAVRKYQFWDFIYDIIGALIAPVLLTTGLIPNQAVNLNLSTAIVISDQQLEKGKSYLDENMFHFLSKNIFNTQQIYSYMVLYMKDYEIDKRDGILEEDMQNGIYHFGIFKDRGIVKSIDFTKLDFPRLRDMRLVTEGFNNAGDLLREHYQMTLKTIGSPLFIVGSQVYFDGSYLGETGRNITELIGLGGYYIITNIETTISKELYETEVKCLWTSMRKTSAEGYRIVDVGKLEAEK